MTVYIDTQAEHRALLTTGHLGASRRDSTPPLHVVIVNAIPNKFAAELQFAEVLSAYPRDVVVTLTTTDDYLRGVKDGSINPKNTAREHLIGHYQGFFAAVAGAKPDAVIVTGYNSTSNKVGDESLFPEVAKVLQWTAKEGVPLLASCWGAKAALKEYHGINSIRLSDNTPKILGVYPHRIVSNPAGILDGVDINAPLFMPVARWKSPNAAAVRLNPTLQIVAEDEETGANILFEWHRSAKGLTPRVLVLSHPEYRKPDVYSEYCRDIRTLPESLVPFPKNHAPGGIVAPEIIESWHSSRKVFTNFLRLAEAVRHDRAAVAISSACAA